MSFRPTREQLEEIKRYGHHCITGVDGDTVVEALVDLALAALSAQQEPVAWMVVGDRGGEEYTWLEETRPTGWPRKGDVVTPLYAAPLAQPGQQGWQPIETGPHSGIGVLLYQPWKSGFDTVMIGHYANGWVIKDWTEYDGMREVQPTHWMPLPAAPVEPAAQEGKNG